jgi:hypothetical protein
MSDIVAIVEGQTEQAFVRDQLAPHLGLRGVGIRAILSGRTGHDGGVKPWAQARRDIIFALRQGAYVTTMFDYYALPDCWPGRMDAGALPWDHRAEHVEARLLEDIAEQMGERFHPAQFIPYIQLHEFEALAFSNVKVLTSVAASVSNTAPATLSFRLAAVVAQAGNPEAIDDGRDTCPSRRISALVPGWRKRTHGPIVTRRTGLDRIREQCAHFAQWLTRLEQLAPGT